MPDLDDAGDVDRDVEPVVRLDDLGDEGLDRGGVAHVADVGHEPRSGIPWAAGGEAVGGSAQLVGVTSAAVDDEPAREQLLRHEQPQPP